MTPLFKKLNLGDHRDVCVIDAPDSFEPELTALDGVEITRDMKSAKSISFAICFVKNLKSVEAAAKSLKKAKGDPVIWFAYPKASSKKYSCEFNRDSGWASLGKAGFEGVRQVAIDEDWSAVRFRRVDHIKSLKRDPSRAISAKGKSRSAQSRE